MIEAPPQRTGWPFLVVAVMLHFFLVLALVAPETQAHSKPPTTAGDADPITVFLVVGGPRDGSQAKHRSALHTDCDKGEDTFTGIGVHYSRVDNEIVDAPPGLPAANAGIHEGDVIPDLPEVMPAPGTLVTLHVIRNHVSFVVRLKTASICYKVTP